MPTPPSTTDPADAARTAACALLARHWPTAGNRQNASLALAGGLLRAGWEPDETAAFLRALCAAVGDEEADRRLAIVGPLSRKIAEGRGAAGWDRLAPLLGPHAEAVLDDVRRLLELDVGQPWPELIALPDVPAVPPFPVDMLPGPLADYLEQAARALGCPADFLALPLLTFAGAALGSRRALEIKPGHREYPALFTVLVTPPGSPTTPALAHVAAPLYARAEQALRDYPEKRARYENEQAHYENLLPLLRPIPPPAEPRPERVWVGDVTTGALAQILHDNPRGLVLLRDDLSALVTGRNASGRGPGNDREFYLGAWAGTPVAVDRKASHRDGPVQVARPFLAVCGAIPSRLLGGHRPGSPRRPALEAGLADRLLFTYPEPCPAAGEDFAVPDPERAGAWQQAYNRLSGLPAPKDPDTPRVVRLTAEARTAWRDFTTRLAGERNAPDFPAALAGPWSTLAAHAARLALIVHALRQVHGEARGDDVDEESLRRAERLIDYFKAHLLKVHARMRTDDRSEQARLLVDWLCEQGRSRLTRREALRVLGTRCATVADLTPVLALLEAHGVIRRASPEQGRQPGRPAGPGYEVNPALFKVANIKGSRTLACGT